MEDFKKVSLTDAVEKSLVFPKLDGKGLRAAARKVRNGKTPYILNALDVSTKLVIGQLAIPEKANEMTAIPELVKMLDIGGSTVN